MAAAFDGGSSAFVCGSSGALLSAALQHERDRHVLSPGGKVAFSLAAAALVLLSGLASGLVLGLLSLDLVDLEVIKRTGTPQQRAAAAKVEKITADPHLLLVALLLTNATAMEALPLFLDRLLNPAAAIAISVSAILVFGEVLPQAVCKRHGLAVGAAAAPAVRVLVALTWPVAWPFARVLDAVLGEHHALFRRAQLKELVALHAADPDGNRAAKPGADEGPLSAVEVAVIHGALDLAHKTAAAVMTPLEKVFSVSAEAALSPALLQQIAAAGFSRVPVYAGDDPQAIYGIVLVKELLLRVAGGGGGAPPVRDCHVRPVDFIRDDTPLFTVMELFRLKRRHLAMLTRPPGGADGSGGGDGGGTAAPVPVGIITVEDVLEELLQTEIQDETDLYVDNRFESPVAPTPRDHQLPPGLLPYLAHRRRASQRAGAPAAALRRKSGDAAGAGRGGGVPHAGTSLHGAERTIAESDPLLDV